MEILTNRKLWLATILAVILVIGIWAWQQSHHPQVAIRNVLLISIDTCRADRLGCYGYWRNTTPRIDAMADRGILFENTISGTTFFKGVCPYSGSANAIRRGPPIVNPMYWRPSRM